MHTQEEVRQQQEELLTVSARVTVEEEETPFVFFCMVDC
jgi:hypothetical protein